MAIGATRRNHLAEPADVAHEAVFRSVVGHGQGAVLTVGRVAAFGALQRAGKTASVEQEDDLFALVQAVVNGHAKALGEDAEIPLVLGFGAHVEHAGERESLAVGALIHAQHAVFALLHIVQGFE